MYDLVTELEFVKQQRRSVLMQDDRKYKQQYINLHRFDEETDRILKEKEGINV